MFYLWKRLFKVMVKDVDIVLEEEFSYFRSFISVDFRIQLIIIGRDREIVLSLYYAIYERSQKGIFYLVVFIQVLIEWFCIVVGFGDKDNVKF